MAIWHDWMGRAASDSMVVMAAEMEMEMWIKYGRPRIIMIDDALIYYQVFPRAAMVIHHESWRRKVMTVVLVIVMVSRQSGKSSVVDLSFPPAIPFAHLRARFRLLYRRPDSQLHRFCLRGHTHHPHHC